MNVIKTGLSLLLMAVITPSFAAEKTKLPAQSTAKVNAQFEVKLPSNPTTGFDILPALKDGDSYSVQTEA